MPPSLPVFLTTMTPVRSLPGGGDHRGRDCVLPLLAWAEGHGQCGGLTYEDEHQRIVCACGMVLFEVAGVSLP